MSDDDHTLSFVSKKRYLEVAVATAEKRATKARQLATEMSAFSQAADGDLYMAKHALQKHIDGIADNYAPIETVQMCAEEEAMMAAAELPLAEGGTRNGYPLNDNQDNITFEALLINGTLDLQRRGNKQQIVPGKNGHRNNIFDNKELFKRTDPRFFFVDKVWQRDAPDTASRA